MNVRNYRDVAEYRDRVQEVLAREEVVNNLPLGLVLRMAQEPGPVEEERRPYLALAEHEGQVPLVMMMTPPHNMILYGHGEHLAAAIEAAIAFLLREEVLPPGVIGPKDVATSFAQAWSRRTGCALVVSMEQMIYRLDRVNEIELSPGELLLATDAHLDLVADWIVAFSEVTHERVERDDAIERARSKIAAADLYLWRDGEPVSMAWRARPTQTGIVVTGVYTPPACRNRGYATACVASLSRLLLDEGFAYCALYADLANPVSNHVYRKIGYRPVRESIVYNFVSEGNS
jgi:hypothetical protein